MGRRRKASTSTVATVDKSHFPWTKEASILRPVQVSVSDNDWPTFVLYDAVIYEKDRQTFANPLFVDKLGSLVVRGRLNFDDDDDDDDGGNDSASYLLKRNVRSANIEIPSSTSYSIGYGDIALWVSGTAGWYEIRPAPEYEMTYLEIYEAVLLYYEALNVIDRFEKACGKGKKKKPKRMPPEPTLDDIFFQYALGAGDGVTRDEAEARYRKWAPFLASHFPKEPDVTWEGTLFAKWIHEVNSEMKSQLADVTPAAPPPSSRSQRPTLVLDDSDENAISSEQSRRKSATALRRDSSQDVEMTGVPSSQVHQLAIRKGKPVVESPVPLPPQYRISQPATPNISQFDSGSPVDKLLDLLREFVAERNRDLVKTKITTIHTFIYLTCKVKDYKAAPEITAFYSKQLLPRLPPEWKDTYFYNYLMEVSKKPLVLEFSTPEQIPTFLARRAKAAKRQSTTLQQPQITDGSDEDAKPGKRARKSGKGAGLRLVSGSKKRPASVLDLDDEPAGGRRGGKTPFKVFQAASEDDGDTSEMSDSESALNTDAEDRDKTAFLGSPPPDSVRVVVHAERIPTMSPTGPNGTWVCEQDGCSYIVRAADEPEGQALVQAHFRHHEAQADRVTLAVKESRGHMPINHLLDKIQMLGKKALDKKKGDLNGETAPAPIKRRLMI